MNIIIMNQWEFSILQKADIKKSELFWTLFGKLIVFEWFLYKSFRISDYKRSQTSTVCCILRNFTLKFRY